MNIELKNIKTNLSFSQETTMFSADIYINGKKQAMQGMMDKVALLITIPIMHLTMTKI
jgi:hypothetical protein